MEIIILISNFLGSAALAKGLFVSNQDALKLGIPKWASSSDKENLKMPQVQEKISQRMWGIIGFVFLTIGFVLQLIFLL
jgi:hypothetical protein